MVAVKDAQALIDLFLHTLFKLSIIDFDQDYDAWLILNSRCNNTDMNTEWYWIV
jgi:hypothetical protein